MALALIGTGVRRTTVAFLGWFGPRGLASIVFAVILIDDADLPHLRTLVLTTAATIALSVYVHGSRAPPLSSCDRSTRVASSGSSARSATPSRLR